MTITLLPNGTKVTKWLSMKRIMSKRGDSNNNLTKMNTFCGLLWLHPAISDHASGHGSRLTAWATLLLCFDFCAFWKLSTPSDPRLPGPQLSIIIIQSRLPCPPSHLLPFFSFFPFYLCVCPPLTSAFRLPINLSFPLTQQSPHSSQHLSHHQLSSTVTFFTSVIFITAALISALLSARAPLGVVWMREPAWRPRVAERKPALRFKRQNAGGCCCVVA